MSPNPDRLGISTCFRLQRFNVIVFACLTIALFINTSLSDYTQALNLNQQIIHGRDLQEISESHSHRKNLVEHPVLWSKQCSEEEMQFQYENIDMVEVNFCDNALGWKFAQMTLPNAKVFLDIGGNLGYSAAHMFSLWSPGHGLNRHALYKALGTDIESKKRNASNNSHGGKSTVCGDGLGEKVNEDYGFICVGDAKRPPNACSTRNNIHVYSFDGDAGHALGGAGTIGRNFPHLSYESAVEYVKNISATYPSTSSLSSTPTLPLNNNNNNGNSSVQLNPVDVAVAHMKQPLWQYIHSAVTGNLPGNPRRGYFMQLGHESSSLIAGDISAEEAKKKKASIVPITTVDRFCLERNISRVDVIKIDVESFEPQVVEGAEETLRKRHVKFLTYECLANCGGNASMALVEKLHSFGFVCYMAGTANIFARMTGCWNEKYKLLEQRSGAWEKWKKAYPNTERSEPAQRLGGNVFCGNQRRAPALTAMLEAHSLHTFANNRRGDVLNEQLLGRPVSVKNGKTIVLPDKNVGEAYTRRSGRDVSTGERLKLPL